MTANDPERGTGRRSRRTAVGVAAAIAAIAGGGAAVAATTLSSSPQQESEAIVSDAAQRLGVEPQALDNALKQAYEARIDEQVKAGELDQAQADALKARIEAGDVPLVGGPGFRGAPGGGDGFGDRMHRGADGREGPELDAAATYLGLTPDALRTQLEAGKSLADVAKAQGKTVEGLKQALTDAVSKALDERVAAGDLTAAEKATELQRFSSRLDDDVNGSFEHRGRPGPGGPGPGGIGVVSRLDTAATYLGLTPDALRTQLEAGKSLADVAAAEGKTVDGLKQALTADVTKTLDERVQAGDLTKAEEASILADLSGRLDKLIADAHKGGFRGGRHERGGPGEPPPGGDATPAPEAPSDAPSTSTTAAFTF